MPVAVVTGATGGIGGAIVKRLLAEGYAVIACGRNEQKLRSLGDQHGYEALTVYPCDVLQQTSILLHDTLCDASRCFHASITLLVCAHGHAPVLCPSADLSAHVFREVYEVDVLGTLKMAQAVYPLMREEGGSMIFISSIHSVATFPERVPYASAKAAVVATAKSLALEWGKNNITVNAISPWQVCGERTQFFIDQAQKESGEDLQETYHKRVPLRRLVQPEDVANAVLFLAKTRSITGTNLVMDCGLLASAWHEPYLVDANSPQFPTSPNPIQHHQSAPGRTL